MKNALLLFVLILAGLSHRAFGQGWHAEIHLEVGNKIVIVENVNVSLSEFTVFDHSRSIMDLTIDGQGPLPTVMSIYVSGYSDEYHGATVELRAQYNLQGLTPCAVDRFYIATEQGDVAGSIVIYPQLEIKRSSSGCGMVSLSTQMCAGAYFWTWEVSDHALGPFLTLAEKKASIDVTALDLENLGLTGYGRKFFRVSSAPGTTSSVKVIDLPYPAPEATFVLNPPKCHKGNDGSIAITITSAFPDVIDDFIVTLSGNGIVKQEVLNNSRALLFSGVSAGSYDITIENNTNIAMYGSCSRSYLVGPLIDPEPIQLQAVSISDYNGYNIACHGDHNGFIKTEASGGTGVYRSYAWTPEVSTTSDASELSSGTYSLEVTDSNGCQSEPVSFTLSEPENLQLQLSSTGGKGGFGVSCSNQTDGVLTAVISGGVPSYRYLWGNGSTQSHLENLGIGMYTISVSDANGCTVNDAYVLTAPDPITFQLDEISGILCAGDQTGALAVHEVRNAMGAVYYKWSSGETGKDISTKSAGTYSVTVSDDQGCHAEASFVLEAPEPLTVNVLTASNYNGFAVSCHDATDGKLQAIASGGTGDNYAFTWQDGTSGETRSDLGAGTYVVTVRDMNGCEGLAKKTLTAPLPIAPVVSVASNYNGQAISCVGAADARLKASATGGVPNFHYTWNTGQSGSDLVDVPAGNYRVAITDANGCEAEASMTVANPTPMVALITDKSEYSGYGVSCNGLADGHLSCSATGGQAPYQYAWSYGGFQTADISALAAGHYEVRVTDANGCSATTETLLTEPEPIHLAIADVTPVNCFGGDDGEVVLLASGGAQQFDYSMAEDQWQLSPLFTDLSAGKHTFFARDQNGCVRTTAATLTEPEPLVIQINQIQAASCGDSSGRIDASVSGGAGGYEYQWQDAFENTLSDNATISEVPAGLYFLAVTDAHACVARQTAGVTSTNGPKLVVQEIIDATCSDSADGSARIEVTGGNGPWRFRWEDGQTEAVAASLSKGDYFVEVTDANGCTTTAKVTIGAPQKLGITLDDQVAPMCHGGCDGSLRVQGIGGSPDYHYLWEDGSIGDIRSNICAGIYDVTLLDGHGCSTQQTFTVSEPPPIVASIRVTEVPSCHDGCNGALELSADGGTGTLRYTWSTGSKDRSVASLCPGTYSVIVDDANNCQVTVSQVLENPPHESLDLGGSATVCTGQAHMLDAGAYWKSVTWSGTTGFESHERRVSLTQAGHYWLEAVSEKGCVALDTFELRTSDELLNANFLLASTASVGDTVMIIDVSWPLPDHIAWHLPVAMNRLTDFADIISGTFADAGEYDVALTATLGECRDEMVKHLVVLPPRKETNPDPMVGYKPFVIDFSLYPNPNEGSFDVSVEFREESRMVVTIWNILSMQKIETVEDHGEKAYDKHFDLRPLSSGTYTVRLDHDQGTAYLRFVVR